jgi:hypothetical protein
MPMATVASQKVNNNFSLCITGIFSFYCNLFIFLNNFTSFINFCAKINIIFENCKKMLPKIQKIMGWEPRDDGLFIRFLPNCLEISYFLLTFAAISLSLTL